MSKKRDSCCSHNGGQTSNPAGILYKLVMEESAPVITLADPTETEDDGLVDGKGVADKTNFTFNVLYTGALAPSNITLLTNDGTTHNYPLQLSATTTNDGIFTNGEWYTFTGTFPKGVHGYHFEANNGTVRFPATGELKFTTGYDNILFLHGIAGSRMYEVSENVWERCQTDVGDKYFERWLPLTDCDNSKLFLNHDGTSVNDLVAKDDIAEVSYTENIYKTFLRDLASWKNTEHIIDDYSAAPYDWRLSLNDILTKGKKNADGYIDYSAYPDSGTEPYLLDELFRLASSSPTHKVTIITHSNGGLVAKELMLRLRERGLENLVDNLFFVAVPEVGTPEGMVALLHGSSMGPFGGIVSDSQQTREASQNMPTAYNLLPSLEYYTTQMAHTVPVAMFDNSILYQKERTAYGPAVGNYDEFTGFLNGFDGRNKPTASDLNSPEIGNNYLFTQSMAEHARIDAWRPASTTKVIEIAGWGIGTIAGMEYGSETYCVRSHMNWDYVVKVCDEYGIKSVLGPITTVNGDETVVSDSAHYLSDKAIPNMERWWVDLASYNKFRVLVRTHKDIFEMPDVVSLIKNKITGSSNPLTYVSITKPTSKPDTITYTLHSPLSISLYDADGNHTGISTTTGEVENNVNGARYYEIGDTKFIIANSGIAQHLTLKGYDEGSFSLDIQKRNGDTVMASTTFSAIPSGTSTIVTLDIPANSDIVSPNAMSPLKIDFNGDGVVDSSLISKPNQETVYDVTPPDVSLSFDRESKALVIAGKDNFSSTTVITTTTSSKITDKAGNTTELIFSKYKIKPKKIELVISVIKQNGVIVSSTPIPLTYKWNVNNKTFASYIKTQTVAIETHYRPKKNLTVVMTKPIDLDDNDDGDDIDVRPTKEKLVGIHTIELKVENGILKTGY